MKQHFLGEQNGYVLNEKFCFGFILQSQIHNILF